MLLERALPVNLETFPTLHQSYRSIHPAISPYFPSSFQEIDAFSEASLTARMNGTSRQAPHEGAEAERKQPTFPGSGAASRGGACKAASPQITTFLVDFYISCDLPFYLVLRRFLILNRFHLTSSVDFLYADTNNRAECARPRFAGSNAPERRISSLLLRSSGNPGHCVRSKQRKSNTPRANSCLILCAEAPELCFG